ncbi:MAG: 50S ribosomal protein L33 [Bacteroidetes bacterium]|nr:50S ribosomal protein L33 [Bacteroidota bacterium]
MSQDTLIKMKSEKSGTVIRTFKNKKQNPEPLSLKKYDKKLRKHVTFKQTKK